MGSSSKKEAAGQKTGHGEKMVTEHKELASAENRARDVAKNYFLTDEFSCAKEPNVSLKLPSLARKK